MEKQNDKIKILIVDDLPDNLRLLQQALTEKGYDVRSATKGITAIRGAKAIKPDLILLDIKMPGLDGYEVAAQLKADAETADIPVIFLSALNDILDKVKGFTVGGVDYITKPFQMEEVLIRIETHLTIRQLQKNLLEHNLRLQQEIQERERIEQELFAEKELAQVTLQSIGDAVITTDIEGRVSYCNPVAQQLTGWTSEQAQGLPLSEIFQIIDEETRQPIENPVEIALRENRIVGLSNHTILIARDGTESVINDSAAPIRNFQGQNIGAIIVFHDVTQARELARQLSWQATHDALTGLANRREFEQQLIKMIDSAKKDNQHHALCYLDLDQFKIINDNCGHIAGDELLQQVTALIQTRVRITDTLARLGGDEFGLLFYQCSLDNAVEVAETLRQLIAGFQFIWDNKTFSIGVSIGVVGIDAISQDLTSVMSAADAACYAAKAKGRNCIHVYRIDDKELIQQRSERQWIVRINQALTENYFRLYQQKIISLTDGLKAPHYEILLRLCDSNGTIIPPMVFIPAAERYDLMPAIDRWVIRTFLANYQRLPIQQGSIYTINLSAASINNVQFLAFVLEQLAQSSFLPQSLCFEITETTAISNLNQAKQFIYEIKKLGCHFALDDFGTGMSSLNYLKNLPLDYLKIDGSFVKNITDNSIDYVMVESFNHIAHALKMKTIAEFVENDAILEKLKEIGIDYAQGYGIAIPCPLIVDMG